MTDTRRLFVAVDIDEASRRACARAIDALAEKAEQARASIRWTPAENLHITLRFIGATPEPALRRITAALEPPIAAAPFEMEIAGIGTFPASGAPRVIWAGLARGAEALGVIAREVEARLQAAGCAPEDRPFRAHLTLGRVRPGPPRQRKAARRILEGVALSAGPARVDRLTLYESRMSSKGSTYHRVLLTWLKA